MSQATKGLYEFAQMLQNFQEQARLRDEAARRARGEEQDRALQMQQFGLNQQNADINKSNADINALRALAEQQAGQSAALRQGQGLEALGQFQANEPLYRGTPQAAMASTGMDLADASPESQQAYQGWFAGQQQATPLQRFSQSPAAGFQDVEALGKFADTLKNAQPKPEGGDDWMTKALFASGLRMKEQQAGKQREIETMETKATPQEKAAIGALGPMVENLKQLRSEYQKNRMPLAKTALGAASEAVGASKFVVPGYKEFEQKKRVMVENYLRNATGAAAPEYEIKRYSSFLGGLSDPPEIFENGLKAFQEQALAKALAHPSRIKAAGYEGEASEIESRLRGTLADFGGGAATDKKALAQQALADPNATEAEKARARQILGQ